MKQATLRIKPHFSIIPHSPHQVELRSGVWNPTSFVIYDESNSNQLYSILKDINGMMTTKEVAKKHQISREKVEGILDHLQRLEVLESASIDSIDGFENEFLMNSSEKSSQSDNILIIGEDIISHEIKRIVMNSKDDISLTTIDINDPEIKKLKTNAQWMFDNFMLQEAVDQFSWWKDYFVILALTHNDPILAMRINQINYTLGIPWIHGAIDGPFIFVGPMFSSKSGPCYHCFEKRVTMNLHEYASYQRYKEISMMTDIDNIQSKKCTPSMHVLSAHLAMESMNHRFSKTCFTKSKSLSIYLPTMEICFNEVLRLSGCFVCGSVLHRDDQQLYYDYQTILENVDHG